jgi:outer membrane protein assembly factor BamB
LAEAICDQPPRKVRSVRGQAPCWVDEAVATALAKDVAARPIASDFSAILREGLDKCLALPSDLRWPEMWPMTGGNQSRTGWDGVPVDLQIGRLWLKWAFETESSITPSAVAKGMVFAGSEDGHVYALDPKTGQERWGASVSPILRELAGARHVPIVVERLVLVGSGDGCVYGFDPTSGRLVWKSKTDDSSDGGSVVGVGVAEGLVVAVTFGLPANSSVCGLDVETGRRLWIQRDVAFAFGSPIVEENTIYVGGEFDLKAFDMETGDTRWTWDGDHLVANPAAAGGKVFFGASHGVYSLDAATGQELWRFQTKTDAEAVTLAGGVVFAGSLDEHVYALDGATGQELWRSKIQGAYVEATPMAIGNLVVVGDIVLAAVSSIGDFIGAGDERLGPEDLFALDARSGSKVWAVDTGLRATGVTVAGGRVFVGSQGGAILAYSDRAPGVGQRVSMVDVALAEEHWKRAIAYVQDSRLSDAARECEAALHINPRMVAALVESGWVYKAMGGLDQATEAFQTALRISPMCAPAHYGLSEVYRTQGRHAEANKESKYARSLAPGYDPGSENFDLNDLATDWGYRDWSGYEDSLPD